MIHEETRTLAFLRGSFKFSNRPNENLRASAFNRVRVSCPPEVTVTGHRRVGRRTRAGQ